MTESERRGFSPTDTREGFFFIVFCFSNMGVVRVMKEMKLSCCKCHFEFFFTTVANDEEGHLPAVPFDILFHTHNDS